MLLLAASALASPFDSTVALGGYASGWGGSYGAAGLGGKLRLEPLRHLGVDLFAEHYAVGTPHGFRHDHPIGFDLYVPLALPHDLRLRPLLGMCAVGSFIQSTAPDAPGADDVLFGAHVGLGLEVPVGASLSGFLDAKTVGWVGHDRAVQGWTGAVDSGLSPFGVAQVNVGVAVHL
jgi:hypothetical protein